MPARHLALAVAATLTGALFLTGSAEASTPPSPPGGLIHIYDITSGSGQSGTIVITGAFADSGKDQPVSQTANRMVLSKGTFEVSTSAIGKAFSTAKPVTNPNNCGVVLSVTAPVTLFNGTGAYKGINGKVSIAITNAALLPKTANGTCDESPNAVAIGEVTIDEGSGTVSFK